MENFDEFEIIETNKNYVIDENEAVMVNQPIPTSII